MTVISTEQLQQLCNVENVYKKFLHLKPDHLHNVTEGFLPQSTTSKNILKILWELEGSRVTPVTLTCEPSKLIMHDLAALTTCTKLHQNGFVHLWNNVFTVFVTDEWTDEWTNRKHYASGESRLAKVYSWLAERQRRNQGWNVTSLAHSRLPVICRHSSCRSRYANKLLMVRSVVEIFSCLCIWQSVQWLVD